MNLNEKESKNYICEYCNSSFISSKNLKLHQKTAKFCLQIQNKPIEENYRCEFCNKGFTIKAHLTSHNLNCKDKKTINDKEQIQTYLNKIRDLENELKHKSKEYENELKQKDKELNKKNNLISELNGKLTSKNEVIKNLEKTNKELLNRPTTINNNDNRQQNQYNIQFNQMFDKLPILNEENVNNRINELSTEEKVNQYDLNNFYKGALENMIFQLKDLSFCTDPSRKMVVVKDESEKSVKMNAEEYLSKCFKYGSESILNHITYTDQVVNDRIDNNDPYLTSEMLDLFNDDRDKFRRRIELNKENFFISSNNTDNRIESGVVTGCIKKLEKCSK